MKTLVFFGHNHVEIIIITPLLSIIFFMEEIQISTFAAFFCDVSSFITITYHYCEQPLVVKILLLVSLESIVSVLSKISK